MLHDQRLGYQSFL